MYDLRKNPPNNRAQVREWLTSWFKPLYDSYEPVVYEGNTYKQEYGLRYGGCPHVVLRNLQTNMYGIWCFELFEPSPFDKFPKKWFPTYDDALTDLVEEYCVVWKLH